MKNKLYFYLAIGCMMILFGCSEDDNHQTVIPKFDLVRSDNIDLTAEGGVATVEFTAKGVEVKAEADADWCRIDEVTGNKVTMTVGTNEGYTSRSAVITLTDGETIRKVAVLQSGAVWIYDRDETTIYANENSNDVIVKMSGTFPIELSIPQDAASWLAGEVTDDGFKLKIQKNATGKRRTAAVTLRMKDRTADYTVEQYVMDDLLGAWGGEIRMSGPDLGIEDTKVQLSGAGITKTDVANQYRISIPLSALGEDVSLELPATYKDGTLTITAPQKQDIELQGMFYGAIILASADGLFLQGNIELTPRIEKGMISYTYGSSAYFCLGFFSGKEPTQNNYTGMAIVFPELNLQRSLQ